MSYGLATQAIANNVAQTIKIVKDDPTDTTGVHISCHTLWLYNEGPDLIYFTYNTTTDPTPTNGIPMFVDVPMILEGVGPEQLRQLRHITVGPPSTFKWTKLN